MTDREMLQLAFRAYAPGDNYIRMVNEAGSDYWNPLTDDGDAFRLAVKCEIDVVQFTLFVRTDVAGLPDVRESYNGDPLAATRRAIVRAAAEIGKGMK